MEGEGTYDKMHMWANSTSTRAQRTDTSICKKTLPIAKQHSNKYISHEAVVFQTRYTHVDAFILAPILNYLMSHISLKWINVGWN